MEANQANAIAILQEIVPNLATPDQPDENLAIKLYRGSTSNENNFWCWLNSDGVLFRKVGPGY